jgi:SWI/SNF-related matrix-associated actin-dependent regulator of chromatin subfamily B protein 1
LQVLVPVRLDMDIEGQKLRDTFLWNRNEQQLFPEQVPDIVGFAILDKLHF